VPDAGTHRQTESNRSSRQNEREDNNDNNKNDNNKNDNNKNDDDSAISQPASQPASPAFDAWGKQQPQQQSTEKKRKESKVSHHSTARSVVKQSS
jgi:hypothetical protein